MPGTKLLTFACLTALLVAAGPARAADPSAAEILDGAKKEAKLVWYSGGDRDPTQAMLGGFEKKYPFISGELVRASSSELATRVEAEIAANRVQGDVFEYSTDYLTSDLDRRGEILEYNSPEYAHFPAGYAKPGHWAATGLSTILILVNTNRVDAANMPASWSDLAKPFWKGKLTIDNLEVSGTGYNWLYDIVGPNGPGWDLVAEIGKNKPGLERGHAGMAQKVAAGEYAAAIEMSDFHLYALRSRTASVPLRGIWPKEGDPREIWSAGIYKRAPHPFAARLFMDYLMSQEGQALYTQVMGRVSARADVALPKFPEMPSQVTYIPRQGTPEDALAARPALVSKWQTLWGLK
jgi:iron(III) transport system substrate-binding protein